MAEVSALGAIIFSKRNNLISVVRSELKSGGVEATRIRIPGTVRECVDSFAEFEAAFVVLDWEAGSDRILEILVGNRKAYKTESHLVFLISTKMDPKIMAVAAEYGVSEVHAGEISPTEIKAIVKSLIRQTQELSPIKQLLIQVEGARKEGELEKAGDLLTKLHIKTPDNARIAVELAELHMERGRWEDAEAILINLQAATPPYARAKHMLARCLLHSGDHNGAIKALDGAQLINPFNIERLLELGYLLLNVNRPQKAKESFDEILGFAPESKSGKLGKSTSMLVLGEINEALNLLREAANTREIAAVFNTAAILAIRQNRYDVALDLYKTALTALGNHPKVMARLYYNMGIGYVKWKKIDKAKSCFQKAKELDSGFKDARHNLAVLESRYKAAALTTKVTESGTPTPTPTQTPTQTPTTAKPAEDDLSGLEEGIGRDFNFNESDDLDLKNDFENEFDDDLM